jgi:hypothetical protein
VRTSNPTYFFLIFSKFIFAISADFVFEKDPSPAARVSEAEEKRAEKNSSCW